MVGNDMKLGKINLVSNADDSVKQFHHCYKHTSEPVSDTVKRYFNKRVARLSKAHGYDHVQGVANCAKIAAKIIAQHEGFDVERVDEIAVMAEKAGWLHDIVRKNTECNPHGPYGAKVIGRLSSRGDLNVCHCKELDTIMVVVALHEINYEQAGQISISNEGNVTLPIDVIELMLSTNQSEIDYSTIILTPEQKLILKSIIIADKIAEAKGPRVLERRSYFASGERLYNGDLKHLLEQYNESEAIQLAFLGETLIRWTIKNPIESYPEQLQPFVADLQMKGEGEVFFNLIGRKYGFNNLQDPFIYNDLIDEISIVNFPKFNSEQIKKVILKIIGMVPKDYMFNNNHDLFNNDYMFNNNYGSYQAEDALLIVKQFSMAAKDNVGMDSINISSILVNKLQTAIGNRWWKQIQAYRNGGDEFTIEFETALKKAFPSKE